MGNGTTSQERFKIERTGRFRWARWNAPLVLLLLAFAFMIVAILSNASRGTPDEGGLMPYVLTALLCTLVAVSTTLIGCASKQTDKCIQSAASEAAGSRKKLLRICRVGLRANRQTTRKISRLEESQRQLLDSLEENRRQLLDKLAKLSNVIESRHDSPYKTTPGHEQELAESIVAVASSNQAMQTRIDGLLLASKLMSGKISETADNQESLHGTVQEHGELLDGRVSDLADEMQQLRGHIDGLKELIQTVAGDVTNLALEQASLHETVENRSEESVRRLETLSEDHKAVRNHVDQLGENVKQASAEAVETVAQRVASRESFQAHAEALDTQLSGLVAAQQQLRGHVAGMKELLQTVAGDVTNVAREQTTLHEAVEAGSEESVRRLDTLSEDHRAVRNCVDQLGEIVKHGSAEAVELISQRVTSRETFQVHAEALDSQLSGLAGAQERLHGHVDGLRELVETVAGDVTNVAREQASLHEAVENRGAESVRRMETLSEESARRMETFSEESTRRLETLSEDHRNVHNHLNRLGENVKHASSEAVETLARRVASRESFEAHAEALDAQFSGLAAAQEQFSGHITGLRELMQAVAGDVSNVAREQANLHEAVETGGVECARRMEALSEESSHRLEMLSEESGRRIETLSEESTGLLETLSQDHAHVHNHLDQLCENVKRASSEAAEQVAQRVASRESFQAHAEMLDVQLSGLATAQEQLRSHICGLREITQAVAGDVTNVARGQATLHEAVETRGRDSGRRFETLSDDHRNVQKHVDQLGETVRQVTADAVKLVAMRVASRECFEAHTEALDSQLSGLATAQEQLRGHVSGLRGLIQAVAGNVTDVAHEQMNLHEAVETKGEETVRHVETLSQESLRRLEALSEDHKNAHDHLDRLGADIKQAGSETAETLLEESVRRFEALSEDHKNAHDHLDRLGADVKQAGSEAAETLSQESVRRFDALSEDHRHVHDHLDRLGADVKQAGSEAAETLSQESVRCFDALSKDHRHVHDHLDQLGADVRQASCEAVETLAQRVTSCESFEVHTEALDAQLSGLAAAQEQLRGHIAGLKELVQSVGGDVSNVAREQVNLHEAVEAKGAESARHIETLSEELDRRLETLWEESAGRLETLSADHVNVHNHLDQLGEDVKQAAETLSEESVRRLEVLSKDHRNVHGHLDRLGEDVKQAAETLSEESVRHLEVLSKDHRNVHNHLDRLDESIKHASAETVDQVTHQVASRESFQAHAEALDAQLSGLAAAQKQLRGHVGGLRDLMQAVAGDVTNVAREQATLHEAVENRGEESAHRLETLSAGHKATHVQLDHLGETVRNVSADAVEMFAQRVASRESFQAHVEALDAQLSGLAAVQEQLRGRADNLREEMQAVAGKQTTLHEAVETGDAESARRLEKLSEDHRAVQGQVEQLSETVKQVSDEAVELVTQRVAIGESLQDAHAEALDVQLTGLSAAQEQLRGHVDGLRELMQAVAGDVTNVAREQATLHDAIETTGAESARGFETLSQDHTNVRNHLDQLGEDVKHASSEAVEKVAERVASRESFQAHAEAIEARMSGIAAAQERLENSVNTAKVNIEKVTDEQASLNGTLQDNTGRVAATMGLIEQFRQTLQDEIGNLAQASRRTTASIEAMTAEQASLKEIASGNNDELVGKIAAISEDQKASLAAFGEDLQKTATDMASIARDQDHIENAISSTCQESLGKLDAIADGQEHWGRKLDADEAKASETLVNIGNLQRQVAAVLDMLNTCVQSLTDVLDSNNEQQSRLEGTINQNLSAIAELISQIQANRAGLENRM